MNHLSGLVVIGLLCAAVSSSPANGPEVGRDAGMIFPLENVAVQLAAESVDVRFDFGSYQGTAECIYHLRNLTDTRQSFEMAFVTNPPIGALEGHQRFYRDLEMAVSVDGSDTPTHVEPVRLSSWASFIQPPPDSLPVWSIAIPPRATARVHMAYRVWPSGGSDGHHGGMGITYHCRPASLWASTIGQARIRFRLPGLQGYLLNSIEEEGVCLSVKPADWTRRGEDFEWTYRDWEPTEDIAVGVSWK